MSEDFRCEVCGTVGRRRRGTLCPEGWLYGEGLDEDSGEVIVLGVCSQECSVRFWHPGPGKLDLTVDPEGWRFPGIDLGCYAALWWRDQSIRPQHVGEDRVKILIDFIYAADLDSVPEGHRAAVQRLRGLTKVDQETVVRWFCGVRRKT